MNILINMPKKVTEVTAASVLVSALHQAFPGSKIDVVAPSRLAPLLKFIPGIFHTFKYSQKQFKGCLGAIRFGQRIARHTTYDLCINLNTSFKSCLLVYFTRAAKKIGFSCPFAPFVLTHHYKKNPGPQHDAYQHLLTQFTGREMKLSGPRLKVPDAFIKPDLSNQPYIMVHCGDKGHDNHIPPAMACELTNYILHKYPMFNLLVAGYQSTAVISASMTGMIVEPERVSVLENENNYTELVRALYNASVVITKDTDIATIARSLDIRAIMPASCCDSPDGEEKENEVWVTPGAGFDEMVSALHVFLG